MLLILFQADDSQKDTDDVAHTDEPVVTAPHNNDQTSDGVNQSTNAPTVSYITAYSSYVATAGIMLCAATGSQLATLMN